MKQLNASKRYLVVETNFRCEVAKINKFVLRLPLNTNERNAEYSANLVTFMWVVLRD